MKQIKLAQLCYFLPGFFIHIYQTPTLSHLLMLKKKNHEQNKFFQASKTSN